MSVLEAMAAGLPVIATRVGAVPQLVEPDRTGVLVQPQASAELAGAIVRVLANPSWADELAQSGRRRVVQEYSSDSMARHYRRLYERLCTATRTPSDKQ